MDPSTYILSPDYVKGLAFDYIETYSFQRGADYRVRPHIIDAERTALKNRKETGSLNADDEERYNYLNIVRSTTRAFIIDEEGKFHPTSVKTGTFKKHSPEVDRLLSILNTPVVNILYGMCLPVYRDAIIFYDEGGNITSILNICLACEYMVATPDLKLNADESIYQFLKQFFIDLEHQPQNDKPTET